MRDGASDARTTVATVSVTARRGLTSLLRASVFMKNLTGYSSVPLLSSSDDGSYDRLGTERLSSEGYSGRPFGARPAPVRGGAPPNPSLPRTLDSGVRLSPRPQTSRPPRGRWRKTRPHTGPTHRHSTTPEHLRVLHRSGDSAWGGGGCCGSGSRECWTLHAP